MEIREAGKDGAGRRVVEVQYAISKGAEKVPTNPTTKIRFSSPNRNTGKRHQR
jgi:hypothetical protein